MNMKSTVLLLLLAALATSCAVFAPEDRNGQFTDLPEHFSLYSEQPADETNRWWTAFNSPELDALIEEALTNSPTIQQAWARLAQADAIARKTGAAQYPTLDYNAGASANTRESTAPPNAGRDSFNSYNLGLAAAYEIDLWGRVKSTEEAASLDREASRENLNTVAITLASRVSRSWIAIISQRLQLDVIDIQLEANTRSLELIELRFRNALSTALDVYQQRQTVAATESLVPQRELIVETERNQLAALLGRMDLHSLEITHNALPELKPLPPTGIPADVLANRPDVRQAGLQLQSADWQVSAARADRLPAIRLTASAGYGNSNIDASEIFDNWAANLAGSITGPIFDGGRRKAEVERARAVADERLAAYRETVITAIREVEDALVSEQKQREFVEKLDVRLDAARKSYEESINRYRNGLIDYTTVLIQLNTLQSIERDRVAAQFALIGYRIDLYRALGGSWPAALTAPN
jgi:NodT family efflux transporter outer membrane factor (OMF) lipoprotein